MPLALIGVLTAASATSWAETPGKATAAAPAKAERVADSRGHTALLPALPHAIAKALARSRLPPSALTVLVQELPGSPDAPAPRLSHRADVPVNPASVMKLVTTYAALDLLGPAYTWATPVYLDGLVQNGTLAGKLYIRGAGDPKLVLEHITVMLQRVQALGVTRIAGDIVLDRSAFAVPDSNPANFDGEPLRPYNAAPDALLLNFKSILLTFTPDRAAGVAQVRVEPPLARFDVPTTVPLHTAAGAACGDYRSALQADFSDPARVTLGGHYASACGERVWPVLYAQDNARAQAYAARVIEGLWLQTGGTLQGQVRFGPVPAGVQPAFEHASPPLADIVRDINKFSNNVMAQQVFLRLGQGGFPSSGGATAIATATATAATTAVPRTLPVATFERARAAVNAWWTHRWPGVPAPVLDNGSGLSRQERISATALGHMLQTAHASPAGPALRASLPIAGVDGTLRNAQTQHAIGQAHMKTGSLRDVSAIAGYVQGDSGKTYILIAIANHPTQAAARPVFDALMDWVVRDE
jgi:serine-type D-Ala-D-Ala carboxypeptidase/endopeptidase (penicillin-binding protein 4)